MDNPQDAAHKKGRETILMLSLIVILGGAIVLFLHFITLGVFSYVIAAILAIALVGFLHYVIWGYALSKQVAGEREERRIKDLLEADQDEDGMSWQR